MRIVDLGADIKLMEAIPPMAQPGAAPAPGTTQQPAIGAPQPAAGQQVDPATAALAMKQKQDRKKQIQDQIRSLEKQLQDLRKQLADASRL